LQDTATEEGDQNVLMQALIPQGSDFQLAAQSELSPTFAFSLTGSSPLFGIMLGFDATGCEGNCVNVTSVTLYGIGLSS
jgi:hypothetical protein